MAGEMYYRIIGRPKKGRCLLLHGFAMDHRMWLPHLAPFLHQYQFLLPDLRGFGRSAKLSIPDRCVVTNYGDELRDILHSRGWGRFHLGGFSLGGLVSMELMDRLGPEQIISYLNVDQSPKPLSDASWPYGLCGHRGPEFADRARSILKQVASGEYSGDFRSLPSPLKKEVFESFSVFLAAALSGGVPKKVSPLLFKLPGIREQLSIFKNWPITLQVMKGYLYQSYDYRSLLKSTSIPISYLVGKKSEIYPCEGQEIIHQSTPNSRLVHFNRSGHDLMLKEPVKFTREMHRFLMAEH